MIIIIGFLIFGGHLINIYLSFNKVKPVIVYENGIANMIDKCKNGEENFVWFKDISRAKVRGYRRDDTDIIVYYNKNGHEKWGLITSYEVMQFKSLKHILKEKISNFTEKDRT
jgi:hypothetical protein